jgi:hypothetical protein
MAKQKAKTQDLINLLDKKGLKYQFIGGLPESGYYDAYDIFVIGGVLNVVLFTL